MKINTIYNESNLDTMAKMPDNFIDLTVTSPPYDNLREYKNDIDKSWGEHVWKPIIKELYRVTKEGGIVVWVVGDAIIDGSESGTSFKQALYGIEVGFKLHDTMIYEKDSPPFPAGDKSNRYSQVFEYMFIFSKGKPNTHNLIKDKKNNWFGKSSFGQASQRQKDGTLTDVKKYKMQEYGYRYNIWRYAAGYGKSAVDKIAYQHPAIFPEALARDHIKSWSNEGDLVYDPFMGSGTTAMMARSLNRNYIGSELSSEYCKIIEQRIKLYKPEKITLENGLSLV